MLKQIPFIYSRALSREEVADQYDARYKIHVLMLISWFHSPEDKYKT